MKKFKTVKIYHVGHWVTDIRFKRKWQAYLFHTLLNMSASAHEGVRDY